MKLLRCTPRGASLRTSESTCSHPEAIRRDRDSRICPFSQSGQCLGALTLSSITSALRGFFLKKQNAEVTPIWTLNLHVLTLKTPKRLLYASVSQHCLQCVVVELANNANTNNSLPGDAGSISSTFSSWQHARQTHMTCTSHARVRV